MERSKIETEKNRRAIETYYRSLAAGDFKNFASLHTEDVAFNLVGNTPVSGRFLGRERCLSDVSARVVKALVPGRFRFAKKWRIMAADENCVVGIMKGGAWQKMGSNTNRPIARCLRCAMAKFKNCMSFSIRSWPKKPFLTTDLRVFKPNLNLLWNFDSGRPILVSLRVSKTTRLMLRVYREKTGK